MMSAWFLCKNRNHTNMSRKKNTKKNNLFWTLFFVLLHFLMISQKIACPSDRKTRNESFEGELRVIPFYKIIPHQPTRKRKLDWRSCEAQRTQAMHASEKRSHRGVMEVGSHISDRELLPTFKVKGAFEISCLYSVLQFGHFTHLILLTS